MDAVEIQYHLRRRGYTQTKVAAELGVHPMTISRTMHRYMVSDRVMRYISKIIGIPHADVFPEYYRRPPKRVTSKVEKVY